MTEHLHVRGPTRLHTITQKIPREKTGLNGALFVHLDYDDSGKIVGLRCSAKGKDDSTLDRILTAIGDAATEIIGELGK